MALTNLIWIEWIIFALTINSMFQDTLTGIRWVKSKDVNVDFFWSAVGIAIILHGLVTP